MVGTRYVTEGARAFLPHVIASGDGHVVNMSSLHGLVAQPNLSAYVTTKFAVRADARRRQRRSWPCP